MPEWVLPVATGLIVSVLMGLVLFRLKRPRSKQAILDDAMEIIREMNRTEGGWFASIYNSVQSEGWAKRMNEEDANSNFIRRLSLKNRYVAVWREGRQAGLNLPTIDEFEGMPLEERESLGSTLDPIFTMPSGVSQ